MKHHRLKPSAPRCHVLLSIAIPLAMLLAIGTEAHAAVPAGQPSQAVPAHAVSASSADAAATVDHDLVASAAIPALRASAGAAQETAPAEENPNALVLALVGFAVVVVIVKRRMSR